MALMLTASVPTVPLHGAQCGGASDWVSLLGPAAARPRPGPEPLPSSALCPSSVLFKLCSEPAALCSLSTQPCRSPRLGAHIKVGDTPVDLSPVAIGSSGRRGGGQAPVGDGARVPVGPVDAAGLDVDIHGVDADALVALEGLLVR